MPTSTLHLTPESAGGPQRPIVVELGSQQLPPRMRLGGLRRALVAPTRRLDGMRRVVAMPFTLLTRVLSR